MGEELIGSRSQAEAARRHLQEPRSATVLVGVSESELGNAFSMKQVREHRNVIALNGG
jgi:hypothetical protein